MISQLLTRFNYSGRRLIVLPESYFELIKKRGRRVKLSNYRDFKLQSQVRLRDDGDIKYNQLVDYLSKEEYFIYKSVLSGKNDTSVGIAPIIFNTRIVNIKNDFVVQIITAKWMTKTGFFQDIYNAGKIRPSKFNCFIGSKNIIFSKNLFSNISLIIDTSLLKKRQRSFNAQKSFTIPEATRISSSIYFILSNNPMQKYFFNSISTEAISPYHIKCLKNRYSSTIHGFSISILDGVVMNNFENRKIKDLYSEMKIHMNTSVKNVIITEPIYMKIIKATIYSKEV